MKKKLRQQEMSLMRLISTKQNFPMSASTQSNQGEESFFYVSFFVKLRKKGYFTW
jgi:hypothetical protein